MIEFNYAATPKQREAAKLLMDPSKKKSFFGAVPVVENLS